MKYKNELFEVKKMQRMAELLKFKGKEANFTSCVFHIVLDSGEEVLKLIDIDFGIKELT